MPIWRLIKRLERRKTMKLQEVGAIAKQRGGDSGRMNKVELIRALQRDEGNNDCTVRLW